MTHADDGRVPCHCAGPACWADFSINGAQKMLDNRLSTEGK